MKKEEIASLRERARQLLADVRAAREDFADDRVRDAFDHIESGLDSALLHLGRTSWLPLHLYGEKVE